MNIKKYNGYFFSGIKQSVEFKSEFYSRLMFFLLKFIVMYFVWETIFPFLNEPLLNFKEIIIYYFLLSYTQLIPVENLAFNIIEDIKSGDIATSLSKPISFIKKSIYSTFGLIFFIFIISNIIFIIVSLIFNFNINYFFLILFIIPYFIFEFLINIIYGLFAFWFTEPWGIRNFLRHIFSIFSGSLLPIFLYPEFFQNLFKFTPFYHGFYSLSLAVLGKLTFKEVLFSIFILTIWSFIFYLVIKIMYKKGIKRLEGLGG